MNYLAKPWRFCSDSVMQIAPARVAFNNFPGGPTKSYSEIQKA
jgi:hypothetical protein